MRFLTDMFFFVSGDAGGTVGRENANNVDLNRNFPDQYGITKVNKCITSFKMLMPFFLLSILY